MILYLHGFNSAPQSGKAVQLHQALQRCGRGDEFVCPALHHRPAQAIAQVEVLMAAAGDEPITLVGSSLGGFYATWLAERHGLSAVLLNPAVRPVGTLEQYLGWQTNLYTGERYCLTETHLAEMRSLVTAPGARGRYLLIVETGDEVLDYRVALEHYAACGTSAQTIVVEGGNHALASFPTHVPRILAFAGIMAAG